MLLGKLKKKARKRSNSGYREDLGIFVRSSWEANVARWLNYLKEKKKISDWSYEKHTFWFLKIKRGVRSYKPDFAVWLTDGLPDFLYEVKGYLDKKSKTKLKRMKKYHPNIEVRVIGLKEYQEIEKQFKHLPNWEDKKNPYCKPEKYKVVWL